MQNTLHAQNITLAYENKIIIENLSLTLDKPQIVSVIGPNGAGKSTLLKAFCRILQAQKGTILLDGKKLHKITGKEVARIIAMLPQSTSVPEDFLVTDLVALGRSPYQKRFAALTTEDKTIISQAMQQTGSLDFAQRKVSTLSGGERQRVWLAMALAQQPKILLLDEPTTFLDIHHQLEIMELVRSLHKNLNIIVVMVLHDLNHALRYSHRIIALKKGTIFADGLPDEVLTEDNFAHLYDVKAKKICLQQAGEEYCAFIPYAVCQ